MYKDYAQELRERLHTTNQIAREHIKQEKIKAKQQYDKKTIQSRSQSPTIRRNGKGSQRSNSTRYRIGPYVVLERINNVNYTIKTGRKVNLHASTCKPIKTICGELKGGQKQAKRDK